MPAAFSGSPDVSALMTSPFGLTILARPPGPFQYMTGAGSHGMGFPPSVLIQIISAPQPLHLVTASLLPVFLGLFQFYEHQAFNLLTVGPLFVPRFSKPRQCFLLRFKGGRLNLDPQIVHALIAADKPDRAS
jgi:hypothetical protein